jgi:hypothetical protein
MKKIPAAGLLHLLAGAAFLVWVVLVLLNFFPEVDWRQQGLSFLQLMAATGLPDLLLLLLCLLLAAEGGMLVLRGLGLGGAGSFAERVLFATALGLGIIAYATLLLGSLQLFYPWLFRSLVAVAVLLLLPRWIGIARGIRWGGPGPVLFRARVNLLIYAFLTFLCLIYLLAALAPETEFDALNYHLGAAKLYITSQGIERLPNIAYTNYPFTFGMLFTFGWLVYSEVLAKLFHFAAGILVAAACLLYCRRYLSPLSGGIAALLFLASPMVAYLFKTAYVDLGLALFVFLALYCLYNWSQEKVSGWLVLAGLFSGLALGTKYLGITALVMLATGLLYLYLRGGALQDWSLRSGPVRAAWTGMIRPFAVVSLVAVLVFSPWLVKNWVLVGNPVAPMMSGTIPTLDFGGEEYRSLVRITNDWGGYEGTLWDYLRSPWLLTQRGQLFAGTPGPLYLAFLPLVLFFAWRHPALLFLLVCGFVGYFFQLAGTKMVRYYLPFYPLMSVLIAGVLAPDSGLIVSRRVRQVFLGTALLIAVLQLPWFHHLWQGGGIQTLKPQAIRFFTSEQERLSYMEQELLGPGGWEVYRFIEREIPPGQSILALGVLYQSLTDRAVYLPPNSSPSNDPALKIIDGALSGQQMATLRLHLPDRQVFRQWRIRFRPYSVEVDPLLYRPRFYNIQDGQPLEIGPFAMLHETGRGWLEVQADLGTARRVSEVRLWDRLEPGRLEEMVLAGRVGREGDWQDVTFALEVEQAKAFGADEVAAACLRHGIRYIVYADIAGIDFIRQFLESGEAALLFQPVAVLPPYRIYRLTE